MWSLSHVVSFSWGSYHRGWELLKTFSSNNFQKEQPSISCKSSVLQNLELRAFKFTDRRFQVQIQTHRWADMSWILFRPGASLKITVIRCEDETFWNIATHYRAILDNLSLSLLYSSYQMLLKMKNSQFWSTDSSLSVSNIWQTSIENCGGVIILENELLQPANLKFGGVLFSDILSSSSIWQDSR